MRGCFILRLVRSRCYESENKGEIDKKEDNEQRQQERRQGEVGKAARGRMNAPTKTRRTATRKWRKEDWDDEPESCAHAAAPPGSRANTLTRKNAPCIPRQSRSPPRTSLSRAARLVLSCSYSQPTTAGRGSDDFPPSRLSFSTLSFTWMVWCGFDFLPSHFI